jgi:hypothetical protein
VWVRMEGVVAWVGDKREISTYYFGGGKEVCHVAVSVSLRCSLSDKRITYTAHNPVPVPTSRINSGFSIGARKS